MGCKSSVGLLIAVGAVVLVPTLSEAAAATAIFGEATIVIDGARALFFGLATVALAYLGFMTIKEVATRRQEGDWMWYGIATVATGAFAFLIIPRIMAPGMALASTVVG